MGEVRLVVLLERSYIGIVRDSGARMHSLLILILCERIPAIGLNTN
jgi:hypothetical protein